MPKLLSNPKNKITLYTLIIIEILVCLYCCVPEGYVAEVKNNKKMSETFSYEKLSSNIGTVEEGAKYVNDSYIDDTSRLKDGVVFTYGPYITLEKGTYDIELTYKTTGENNEIKVYSQTYPFLSSQSYKLEKSNDFITKNFNFSINNNVDDFELYTIFHDGDLFVKSIKIKETKDSSVQTDVFGADRLLSQHGNIRNGVYVLNKETIPVEIPENGMVLTYGPYTSLNKGNYKIEVTYRADGNNNEARLYSMSNPSLSSNYIKLLPSDEYITQEMFVSLKNDMDDFEVQTVYYGGEFFDIKSISITCMDSYVNQSSAAHIALTAFILIVCFALLDLVFLYIDKNREQIPFFIMLSAFCLFISSPLFIGKVLSGHDVIVHVGRIYGIRDGLLDGNLFVKIQENWLNGYGYSIGVFYGDILLYIPAVLSIVGIPMETCYLIFIGLTNFATAFISYLCFRKIFKSDKIGFIGSILYTGSIYRLVELYLRQSVGEYSACIFLPLIVYGFYKVFYEKDEKIGNGWIYLSVAFALIVNSHILSCEMVAVFIILFLITQIPKFKKKKVLINGGFTILATLGLSASFIVPFIDYMITGGVYVTDASRNTFKLQDRGISLASLFVGFTNVNGKSSDVILAFKDTMSLTIGLAAMAGIVFSCIVLFILNNKTKRNRLLLVLSGTFLSIFMTTKYFPWDAIRNIKVLENAVSSLQFPWRYMLIAGLFASLSTCMSLSYIKETEYEKYKTYVSIIIISLLIIVDGYYLSATCSRTDSIAFNIKETFNFMRTGGEYLPVGTDLEKMDGNYHIDSEDVFVSDYKKDGLDITMTVKSNEDISIELPLLYYKYYRAEGSVVYETNKGENNFVTVYIPAETNDVIQIGFKPPIHWYISYLITLVSIAAIILAATGKYGIQKEQRHVYTNKTR